MTLLSSRGKAPVLLGRATGATTTVGPITWNGVYEKLLIFYFIAGYNGGTPVGRLLLGKTTISTTALTNGSSISEGVTAPSSTPSIPGIPLAVTLSAIAREGHAIVTGASGTNKRIDVVGQNGTASPGSPPTLFRGAGVFSDLGTNLLIDRCQLTVYDTLTATSASAQTFTSGTTLEVWGFPP